MLAAPNESLESLTEVIPFEVSSAAKAGDVPNTLPTTKVSTAGVAVVRVTPRSIAGTILAAVKDKHQTQERKRREGQKREHRHVIWYTIAGQVYGMWTLDVGIGVEHCLGYDQYSQ